MAKRLLALTLFLLTACGGGTPDTTVGDGVDEAPTETTAPESGPTGEASGDCETDIAALVPIIEEHGLISNLTPKEVEYASGLISSIGANCSIERGDEFFAQPEVDEFMSG